MFAQGEGRKTKKADRAMRSVSLSCWVWPNNNFKTHSKEQEPRQKVDQEGWNRKEGNEEIESFYREVFRPAIIKG